jgi:hypothetical protein
MTNECSSRSSSSGSGSAHKQGAAAAAHATSEQQPASTVAAARGTCSSELSRQCNAHVWHLCDVLLCAIFVTPYCSQLQQH